MRTTCHTCVPFTLVWVSLVAWLFGVTVRGYRELEAGNAFPTSEVYERIRDVSGGRIFRLDT